MIPAGPLLPALLAAGFAVAFLIAFAAGRRQVREGGGRRGRHVLVAAAAAGMAVLPVLAAAAAAAAGLPVLPLPALVGIGALALLQAGRFLAPPVRLRGSHAPLTAVDDPAFLEQIATLSSGLGISPPRVRLLRSVGSSLDAQAFAGGLVAPSLVVTDGVVHRLEPGERDAIVAHELAHVATGSLWALFAGGGLAWTAGALLGGFLAPLAGFAFAAAFHVLGLRLLQRRVELACDRAAAGVAGFPATIAALDKIHRVHDVPNEGTLPLLLYATASHPHPAVRAACLRAAAGIAKPAGAAAGAARHRRASSLLLGAWGVVLGGAWVIGRDPAHELPVALVLVLATAHSSLLLVALAVRHARRRRRRIGLRPPGRRATCIGLAVVLTSVLANELGASLAVPGVLAGVLLLVVTGVRAWPLQRLRQRVAARLREHDFAGARAVAATRPDLLVRDPALRHDVCLLLALTGERGRAVQELRALAEQEPRLLVAPLARAILLLPDDPRGALAAARAVGERLPDDPLPALLEARALVKTGDLDGAEEAVLRAHRLDPRDAAAHAVRVEIALARGDVARAASECRAAHQKGPGDALVRLARARLAVAAESREQALRLVEDAVLAAEAAPFAFLTEEARALRDALAERTLRT